jgi:catechol 2,3-dioxygenase-like lactoylglutathione lyase family enzyme
MKFICPLIAVKDIKTSREFYEKLLDQKVKFDFGENITFEGDFAIHLMSHFSNLIDNQEIKCGGNNFELYFEYDDVDKIVLKLKSASVVFVHEVREQPWRQKVVRFYDPDLNIIEIGESMEFLV